MEQVSILSIVSNTTPFIDFAAKLISKTHAIYRSGSLVEHNDIRLVGKDMEAFSKGLVITLQGSGTLLADNDRALFETYGKCVEVASDIESALSRLEAKG
ncbi:hypothetical protein K458DRAFT_414143 [Lentithecium fluviatile CBS 122367]|uniref:Uncharacterized protein n=1 Tax=Lentithecium fluviatile CBS 122367 TaxID=1168545 RepID=A0A6G1JD66_9PLEO|nr:hypothetical protein K458DRAFT_414143 [Lentithecium fluviatile CBS 122367]